MPLDPTNLELDMTNGFTLGEMVLFEEASGLDIHTLNRKGSDGEPVPPSARALLGLAFVAARRQDPRCTLAEVRALNPSALKMEAAAPLAPPPPPSATGD
jgi:hypothetical protein